jgi:hypothetical protein
MVLEMTTGKTVSEEYFSVAQAARAIGARPQDVSAAFYKQQLRDDLAPIVGGRRLIHRSLLPVLIMVLRRNGRQVTYVRQK